MPFKKGRNLYSDLVKDNDNISFNFTFHVFNLKILLKQNSRIIKAKFKL